VVLQGVITGPKRRCHERDEWEPEPEDVDGGGEAADRADRLAADTKVAELRRREGITANQYYL
ncbi:MAG TPA: hypothetical protein VGG61_08290, partial [Gemmataceae bacterium]